MFVCWDTRSDKRDYYMGQKYYIACKQCLENTSGFGGTLHEIVIYDIEWKVLY